MRAKETRPTGNQDALFQMWFHGSFQGARLVEIYCIVEKLTDTKSLLPSAEI